MGKHSGGVYLLQGRDASVLRDGRGWKALVARRRKARPQMLLGTVPSISLSRRLGPGRAHCPASASPQPDLPQKPHSCIRAPGCGRLGTAIGKGGVGLPENFFHLEGAKGALLRSTSLAARPRCWKWKVEEALLENRDAGRFRCKRLLGFPPQSLRIAATPNLTPTAAKVPSSLQTLTPGLAGRTASCPPSSRVTAPQQSAWSDAPSGQGGSTPPRTARGLPPPDPVRIP